MTRWACLNSQRFEREAYALVPVAPQHIEPIRCWRNAQMNVLRQATPISPAQQAAYYARHIWPTMEQQNPANILVGFLHRERLIGYGGLVHIAWECRRAEVSFLLDNARVADEAGYGRDFGAFLGLLRDLAFSDLGLHRLFTETYAMRRYHVSVLEASGFRLEGTLRDHVVIDGEFVDSLIHGIIRTHEK